MVKTIHPLRKAPKLPHKILNVNMHPDKTDLGCIKKDFDCLGVHFRAVPTIAKACQEKHPSKLAQRYAQGASTACIGDYVAWWTSCCSACAEESLNKPMELELANLKYSIGYLTKEYQHEKMPDRKTALFIDSMHPAQWVRSFTWVG